MKKKIQFSKISTARLINAVLWAVMILSTSFVLRESGHYQTVFVILMLGYSFQFPLFEYLAKRRANHKEAHCTQKT